jgi:predicted nuclease of predicted toxin-antitoxin system
VKLLLDQNLSYRFLHQLLPHFPGSTHTKLAGLATANDAAVWRFANEQGFIIVSKDTDFQELSVLRGHPPKVVLLRFGNVSNRELMRRLMARLDAILAFEADPNTGCLELD